MAFPFLGAGVLDGGQQIGPGGPAGPGPARGGDGCSRRGASPSRCQGALDRSRGLGRPRRESWALATWCAAPWQERGAGRAARSTPHRGWAAPAAVPGGSRLHSPPVPPIPLKLELRLAGDPVPCPARVEKEKKKKQALSAALSGDKRPRRSGSPRLSRCAFRTRLHLSREGGAGDSVIAGVARSAGL